MFTVTIQPERTLGEVHYPNGSIVDRYVFVAKANMGGLPVWCHPSIDPVALLAIAVLTAAVGMAAAFVPARRASRIDPYVALRHERPVPA